MSPDLRPQKGGPELPSAVESPVTVCGAEEGGGETADDEEAGEVVVQQVLQGPFLSAHKVPGHKKPEGQHHALQDLKDSRRGINSQSCRHSTPSPSH